MGLCERSGSSAGQQREKRENTGEPCHSPNAPGRMVGTDWLLHRRMRATKRSERQGHSEQRWLCTPQCGHPRCWGCHKFTGAPWRLGRLWERKSSSRSSSESCRPEDGEGHAGTLTRRRPPGRWWGWGSRRRSSPRRPRARSSCSEPCTPPRTAPCSHRSLRDRTGWARARQSPLPGQGRCAGGCHGSAQQHGTPGHIPTPEGRAALCPAALPLLAAVREEHWEQREERSSAPEPVIPQQLLHTTAAPAPRRRDVTGGCCRENRPPPRSLQHRVSARDPPPDAHGSQRSCRAGSMPGSAWHGTARHGPV